MRTPSNSLSKEKSLANLRPPWKPGESGNPKGKPKGTRDFTTIFEEAAREVAEALKLGKKPNAVQVELVRRGIKKGLGGNFNFYKDIFDRIYGKPVETMRIGAEEETIAKMEEMARSLMSPPKKKKK